MGARACALAEIEARKGSGNRRRGSRRDVEVGRLGSYLQAAMHGWRKEQVASPWGCVRGNWMLGADSPLDSCPTNGKPVQYPTDSLAAPTCPEGQVVLLPNFCLPFGLLRATASSEEVECIATFPDTGLYPSLLGMGGGTHPLPGCFLCNRGSFLPLTPRVLFFGL